MPVKTRGTKTSPWGLFSSQRLPLILLAMLTLYRMCIKPNKSFHLLSLIHESADHFSKCFLLYNFTASQLNFKKKRKKRSPIAYFFQNVVRLFLVKKVMRMFPNTVSINEEALSPQISSHISFLHFMVNNQNTHFVNYQCISQLLLNPDSGASSGKNEMVKDRNGTDLLFYLNSIHFVPLQTHSQHFLSGWRLKLLFNSQLFLLGK